MTRRSRSFCARWSENLGPRVTPSSLCLCAWRRRRCRMEPCGGREEKECRGGIAARGGSVPSSAAVPRTAL